MSQSKGDILKVRLGNDLRRLVLYNTHISYDDLVLMLQRVYGGKLKSSDEVTLKYYDDDDDLITIADATDFAHAREYSSTGVVKVVIYVNGRDIGYGPLVNAKGIRKELTEVRDRVNSLVDSLDTLHFNESQFSVQPSNDVPVNTTQADINNMTTAVTEAISAFDPLKPSTDYSTITTTVTTQLPVTSTISQVTATSSASGSASHLFSGQNGGSSFLDNTATTQPPPPPQMQIPQAQPQPQTQVPPQGQGNMGQYAQQPTAPPPSSTPQPNAYSYPPTSQQPGYPGSSGAGTYPGSFPQYQQQQQQQPTSTGNPYAPGQPQPNASYNPYGPGNNYQPSGSYPSGGRGYSMPRNSPYRVGY